MDPAAERRLLRSGRAALAEDWTTSRGLCPTPCPTRFRPTEAVCRGRFFSDRAEARLDTSRRAYFGLDPLHHKGREIGRGLEMGAIRRLEAAVLWSDRYGKLTT